MDRLSVSSAPPLVRSLRSAVAFRGPKLPVVFGAACVLGFVLGNKVSVFSR